MDQHTLLLFGLGGVSVVCVLVAGAPYLTGAIKAERRREAIVSSGARRVADRSVETGNRRKQIADSLKEQEDTGKRRRKATLATRLGQAGLTWTPRGFLMGSAVVGVVLALLAYGWSGSALVALGAAFAGGFGLPNWYLKFKAKRRINKFIQVFPHAIDIIVRGIRAGLPLGDCLRVIVTEVEEPVRSEFRHIVESQGIGLPLAEAVERIAERVPIAETSFFAIVISIQQKAGGNLSEALANLSRVLRERRKMQGKVTAMSSEAKSSASIIGSMPFVVGFLIWLTSPQYISILWQTSTGQAMMVVGVVWMLIGVFVMKKMISFEI